MTLLHDGGDDAQISSYKGIQVHCGVPMKKIFLFALIVLCAPLAARAAGGGACPSDAQYINPANPTGPLVTLVSLGVTNCYYIAANGSDSNSGTSEASPWQHAPGMPNCASGSTCHITPVAGEGFIFRGGDTWHYFTGSPQVGLPSGWPTGASAYAWDFHWSGNSSAEIYIGVDQSWSASTPWTRPVFTNDNPKSTSPVASCKFPQGNLDDVAITSSIFVQFDNFEFTGMCWNDRISSTNAHNFIQQFGQGPSYLTSFRTFSNLYIHGWTHVAFNPAQCAAGSFALGVTCNGPIGINGDTHNGEQGTLIVFMVCDGTDSDDLSFGCVAGDGYDVEENVFRHIGGTQILDNCHTLHDNLFEYINNSPDNATHSDMWFCIGEYALDNHYYNNLIRYVGTTYNQPLSTILWLNGPGTGFTDYVFNNVGHDVNCAGNCNNFDFQHPGTSYLIYNNTWESMNNTSIWKQQNIPTGASTFTSKNNHYITNNGSGCAAVFELASSVNGGNTSCSGDIFQTIAAANAQGYTSANDYAPTASATATVGKVANESALSGTFGPAFLQSTSNGCGYNTANHTVVCPAVTVGTRLSSGNWDAGAYISGASNANQPPAPVNLTATVNN
jgi:hypothetical protein